LIRSNCSGAWRAFATGRGQDLDLAGLSLLGGSYAQCCRHDGDCKGARKRFRHNLLLRVIGKTVLVSRSMAGARSIFAQNQTGLIRHLVCSVRPDRQNRNGISFKRP
jgi:hypothetical protein